MNKSGLTLLEIVVVLIIVGVILAFTVPDYTTPTEQARAMNAQNNLLAIYTAQQNYANNNGGNYCTSISSASAACQNAQTPADPNCADNLAAINCNLSLNIPDDGTYTYGCWPLRILDPQGPVYPCTAVRNDSTSNLTLIMLLNEAIQISGEQNPSCTVSRNRYQNWCPGSI